MPDDLSREGQWRYLTNGLLAKFSPPVAVRTLAFMVAIRDDHHKRGAPTADEKLMAYARAASAPLDPRTLKFIDPASIFDLSLAFDTSRRE